MEKITESEKKCLRLLADAWGDPEACVLFSRHLVRRSGLNITQVRRAVRSLVRKGLAERTAAYDCDDGLLMGSGYIVTLAGEAHVKAMAAE